MWAERGWINGRPSLSLSTPPLASISEWWRSCEHLLFGPSLPHRSNNNKKNQPGLACCYGATPHPPPPPGLHHHHLYYYYYYYYSTFAADQLSSSLLLSSLDGALLPGTNAEERGITKLKSSSIRRLDTAEKVEPRRGDTVLSPSPTRYLIYGVPVRVPRTCLFLIGPGALPFLSQLTVVKDKRKLFFFKYIRVYEKKQEIVLKYDRNKGMSFKVLFFVFILHRDEFPAQLMICQPVLNLS